MTLDDFLKHEGETLGFPQGKYVGECLSLVKQYILEVFGLNPPPSGTNSAYGYWSNFPSPLGEKFERIDNTGYGVPTRGDIVIWKPWEGNEYGHIAIFLEGDDDSFKSFDQNWGGRQAHVQEHNYDNVQGWLHPKETMTNELTDEQKRILEFLAGKTEGQVREAFGSLEDKKRLEEQVREFQKQFEIGAQMIATLEAEIREYKKSDTDWQTQLKTAREMLEAVTEEKNQNWMLYKSKNDDYNALKKQTESLPYVLNLAFQLLVKKIK